MAKDSKAVATKESSLPAEYLDQMASHAGLGAQDATTEDMAIPFIKCAQSLSDEVDKRHSSYIEGLEVGDFFNTATTAFYKSEAGFYFIPVMFRRTYLEWTPRDAGGGFNGEHDASILQKTEPDGKGGQFLENGNEIVVTAMWYGMVVDKESGECSSAVISLAKTQYKKSRQLMTKLKSVQVASSSGKKFNPPIFYNVLHITSVPESNDQGKWMGWKIELDGNVFQLPDGGEIYDRCHALLLAVQSGEVKAASPDERPADTGGSNDAGGNDPDEDIPF